MVDGYIFEANCCRNTLRLLVFLYSSFSSENKHEENYLDTTSFVATQVVRHSRLHYGYDGITKHAVGS